MLGVFKKICIVPKHTFISKLVPLKYGTKCNFDISDINFVPGTEVVTFNCDNFIFFKSNLLFQNWVDLFYELCDFSTACLRANNSFNLKFAILL